MLLAFTVTVLPFVRDGSRLYAPPFVAGRSDCRQAVDALFPHRARCETESVTGYNEIEAIGG